MPDKRASFETIEIRNKYIKTDDTQGEKDESTRSGYVLTTNTRV